MKTPAKNAERKGSKMEDIYTMPIEELTKNSKIKLNVCDHEVDMYWKVAIEVLETIAKNNREGKTTFMIVPYGPLGPYFRLTYFINKYRISLKNCVFCNMDEYLTDDKKYIGINDPLSFRGGMNRIFYSQIDDELNVLPENRHFPDPEHPDNVLRLIEKYGAPDMVFGGVGINGHYAFNGTARSGRSLHQRRIFKSSDARTESIARNAHDQRLHERGRQFQGDTAVLRYRGHERNVHGEKSDYVHAAGLECGRASPRAFGQSGLPRALLAVPTTCERHAVRNA